MRTGTVGPQIEGVPLHDADIALRNKISDLSYLCFKSQCFGMTLYDWNNFCTMTSWTYGGRRFIIIYLLIISWQVR